MADIFEDNDDNEDLTLADREWNKLNQSLEKDGFRDGITDGKESGRQKGFDLGYNLSFNPFSIISSFEAIIDVLSFKLKTIEDNEEISSRMKTIKSDIRQMYESVDKHLSGLETYRLDSNTIELSEQTICLFESTKRNSIKVCEDFNQKSLSELINNLSLLKTNQL